MTIALNAPQRSRYSDHSLAVYLAPLVHGRRVAVVGPTSGDVAKRFRALGAATVVAFGGAGEGVAVRALTPGAIAAFHGRIDCVVVPDAAAVPLAAVLDEARRALGQEGIVAVASQVSGGPAAWEPGAGAGPGYYDLQDALQSRFAAVQMLGRGPFIGYTIAAMEGGSGELTLDTRLVPEGPAPAEAYIAVASDTDLPLDGVALVQVPSAEFAVAPSAAAASALDAAARIEKLEADLAERDAKLKDIENASAERWVKVQRLEHELKSLDEEARKARDRAVRLSKDLEDERKLRQRIELETQMSRRAPELPRGADPDELRAARERAAALEGELASARAAADAAAKRLADLERELDETQSTEAELRAQLDEAERARDAAQKDLERARSRATTSGGRAPRAAASDRAAPAPAAAPAPVPAEATPAGPSREELEGARAEVAALRARLADAEAAAKAAVAKGQSDPDREALEQEFARVERELRARADEVIQLGRKLEERDAAVRELAFSLGAAESTERAREVQAARERIAELSSLGAALASEAAALVDQNEKLRARVAELESDALGRANEVEQARLREEELAAQLRAARAEVERSAGPPAPPDDEPGAPATDPDEEPGPPRVPHDVAQLRLELELAKHRELVAQDALAAAQGRGAGLAARLAEVADEIEAARAERSRLATADGARAAELARALTAERARVEEIERQLTEARNDLSRQYALMASIEDRATQVTLELQGARAGYERRVRELEREVHALVQALEVAGAHSSDEAESVDTLLRELDVARAEKSGVLLRMRDAEAALAAQRAARMDREAASSLLDRDATPSHAGPGDLRSEQLLSDLAETAARLASTEEALAEARETALIAENRANELTRELEQARASAASSSRGGGREASSTDLEALRRESAERELMARSLVAQLEDRDLRLRAMERRLVEEVERARRTESEIWEVELRARDQRIVSLSRDLERARSGDEPRGAAGGNGAGGGAEADALRTQLEGRERELRGLRAALDQVRAGLSSILVDGRGAVVAHDLVSILRQLEEPLAG